MLAMAWMYAAMGGLSLRPAPAAVPAMDMPGMDLPGHGSHSDHGGHAVTVVFTRDLEAHAAGSNQYAWVGGWNWVCTIGFALATLYWIYRYFTGGGQMPTRATASGFCQVAMALGGDHVRGHALRAAHTIGRLRITHRTERIVDRV